MKKDIKMFLAFTVCALMLFAGMTVSSVGVSAAVKTDGTIDLQKKALIIPKGKKTAIKGSALTIVKNCRYQVKAKFGKTTVGSNAKWKSTKPSVVTTSKAGVITAKKPGSATLKITYKNKNQSLKIKVVASHKHSFKTTKKATCRSAGKKTCTACGTTASIAKTAHNYETKTWTGVEGRGKPYYVTTFYCNGCNIDMTNWTADEMASHRANIEGFLAGTDICFKKGTHGVGDEERYNKYAMVKNEETYCKTCGAHKDLKETELYEVYYDDWRNVVRKSDNKIIEESDAYKNYKPYLEAAGKLTASNAVVSDNMIETE